MAKKEETAVETAQKETVNAENEVKTEVVAENATTEETAVKAENLEAVEVPENAEEISQEEALKAAVDEVNRLREENTAIKQELDSTKEEPKKLVEHTNTEAGIAGKQIVDLDAKVKELEEKLADPTPSVEETLSSNAEQKVLQSLIDKVLTSREKFIINLRYGLNNTQEKTQREIASSIGISRSYVSRIEKKALSKLRKAMNDIFE